MFLNRGFTIVELMVVIVVMSILAAVIFAASFDSGEKSRDAKRQTDLKTLQTAVELYKLKYGRYPLGCNGATTGMNQNNWSGHSGTYACPSGNQYIVGLAPEFIAALPTDPKINSANANSGYVYAVNSDGSVYKIMALDTVESESISFTHEFYRCGTGDPTFLSHECTAYPNNSNQLGTYVYNGSAGQGSQTNLNQCKQESIYINDYAVFGGYSDGDTLGGTFRDWQRAREFFSDIVRCK